MDQKYVSLSNLQIHQILMFWIWDSLQYYGIKFIKFWKKNDNVPSLEDVWIAAQSAWETITAIDIEVLFRTLHARMQQVIEFDGRNDMPIPHGGIREIVEAEDKRLKFEGLLHNNTD